MLRPVKVGSGRLYKVKSGHFIGDDSFVEQAKQKAAQVGRSSPRHWRRLSAVEDLAAIAVRLGGLDRETLACASRQAGLNRRRQTMAYVGRRCYRFSAYL